MIDLLFMIKVQATLAAGYALYVLFFRKGAALQARRMYLLLLPLIAVIVPLLSAQTEYVRTVLPVISVQAITDAESVMVPDALAWPLWLIIYTAFVCLMEAAVLVRFTVMALRVHKAKTAIFQQAYIIEHASVAAPHSFFQYIFLPPMPDGTAREMILRHELAHARQWHSADVIYMMIVRALFWINPISWIMFRELRLVHECIADESAGRAQPAVYASLLIDQHFSARIQPITNTFYQPSQIKQRLMMLNAQAKTGNMKHMLLLIPFIALLGIMNLTAQESQKPSDPLAGLESMPEFPGGSTALVNYLVENLKYPETASKAGIQGTVFVEFVVKKNGKVDDVKVVKGADPALDAEAVRVVESMPKWKPAKKEGKDVSTSTMLPIRFSLN